MRAWWSGVLAVVTLAAACGGVSTKRSGGSGGSGDEGSGGGNACKAGGRSTGGSLPIATGGTGGSATPGGGGTSGVGKGGTTSGGTGGTDTGGIGTGGAAGECAIEPTSPEFRACALGQHYSECAIQDACAFLECGEPWSPFTALGCNRDPCKDSSECPTGKRCVAPPIAGKFELPHGELDDCYLSPADCNCYCGFFEGFQYPSGHCLSPTEVPPVDCPIETFDCERLYEAARATKAHIDLYQTLPNGDTEAIGAGGQSGEGDTLADLEACLMKIYERLGVCPF